jgi:HlyD family secretion protein
VTALTKEVGEAVLGNNMTSGDVIMKISGLSAMEVNVEVNESDIVRVHLGDTAEIEVDAFRNEKFFGVVTEIGNTALNLMSGSNITTTANNQVTNFSVKISILPSSYAHIQTGKDSPFRPGMTATVNVLTKRSKGVLSIPIKSVTMRPDTVNASESKTCVFVYDETNHKAQLRFVKTGIQDDQFIHVLEGIQLEEQVITGPYDEIAKSLNNGDQVTKGELEKVNKPS